jgi:hypothetical protein
LHNETLTGKTYELPPDDVPMAAPSDEATLVTAKIAGKNTSIDGEIRRLPALNKNTAYARLNSPQIYHDYILKVEVCGAFVFPRRMLICFILYF